MHKTFEDFEREASRYSQIILNYKNKGEIFTDPNFHPNKNIQEIDTIFSSYTKWLRIDELYTAPLFKPDLIHPDYIRQGYLGNCYFVSALSQLSTQPYLVPYLFDHKSSIYLGKEEDTINIKCGAVVIYLHAFGRKTPILIDTLIPTSFNYPIFSSLRDSSKSPWFILVEKAYAKLYGSYSEIVSGTFDQSIYSLYGYSSKTFFDWLTTKDPAKLFDKLFKSYSKGAIIGASVEKNWTEDTTEENLKKTGLVSSHSFVVLKMVKVEDKNLVCLRNPWGTGEWKGDYSDESELWTPELREKVGSKVADDGTFWMNDSDFFKYFGDITICKPIKPNFIKRVICCEMLPRKEIIEKKFDDLPIVDVIIEKEDDKKPSTGKHFIICERRHTMLDKDGNLNPKHDIYTANGISQGLFRLYKPKVLCYNGSKSKSEMRRRFAFIRNDESECSDYVYVSVFCDRDFKMYIRQHPDDLAPEIERAGPFDDFATVKKPYLFYKSEKRVKNQENKEEKVQNDTVEIENKSVSEKVEDNSKKVKYSIRPLKKVDHKSFHINVNINKKHDELNLALNDGKNSKEKEKNLDEKKSKEMKSENNEIVKDGQLVTKEDKGSTKKKSSKAKKTKEQAISLDENSLNTSFKSIRDRVMSTYLEDK